MNITIRIDTSLLTKNTDLTLKQLAYAGVNAVNNTVRLVQRQVQDSVKSKFTLRKPDFILRQVAIIKPFASVGQARPFAVISVGQRDRLLLPQFEDGGTRQPFVGKNVAVPITGNPARPGFDNPVESGLRMTALGLKPTLTDSQRKQRLSIRGGSRKETAQLRKNFTKSAGAQNVWEGNQRTYMIPGLGVFQRVGPKKRDTVMLYKFKSGVQLRPILGFHTLTTERGQALLRDNLSIEIAKAMQHLKH